MGPTNDAEQKLLEKIKRLPPDKTSLRVAFVIGSNPLPGQGRARPW